MALLSSCGASGDGSSSAVGQVQPRGGAGATGAPVLNPGKPGEPTPSGAPTVPGGEGPNFDGVDLGTPNTGMGCQQAQRSFVPKTPTVFILVDRSGTMFDTVNGNTNTWNPLRTGVLQVISELEEGVRFGFGAFVGDVSQRQCAVDDAAVVTPQSIRRINWEAISPDINNRASIADRYNSLGAPPNKGETPTGPALTLAARELWKDDSQGDKYLLYVTDGQPDYCDDGNQLCPPDSVVGKLQQLALGIDEAGMSRQPIHTLVFGIQSQNANVLPETLQAFANAGEGLPVAPPRPNGNQYDPNALHDQCNGVAGWAADLALTGKDTGALPQEQLRRLTVGTYIDPTNPLQVAGTATVYRPDPTDQNALIGQIRTALAGVKSCSFDLSGDVLVDLNRADLGTLAKVIVNGKPLPFDAVNGWHMASASTVQLEGAACADWRVPGETSIDFDFPCDVIIVR